MLHYYHFPGGIIYYTCPTLYPEHPPEPQYIALVLQLPVNRSLLQSLVFLSLIFIRFKPFLYSLPDLVLPSVYLCVLANFQSE